MFYPALFTPAEEGGFVVTFPDLPEAITQGDTFEEAMEWQKTCYYLVLNFISMKIDAFRSLAQ
ncbi:type II toxin-antitoxin system HicB family antitoxin [Mannheimia haemolytica]|uniref:type II toxin-antitoxin system HicB family antitoxin n=1 Tax=Mannheimia haemolytica TaxID=75985 RepID=UPI001EE177F0|nr:type II toxin-antitoxin system HicB family antitoxin [Mannheimia haemolytica]